MKELVEVSAISEGWVVGENEVREDEVREDEVSGDDVEELDWVVDGVWEGLSVDDDNDDDDDIEEEAIETVLTLPKTT